MRGKILFGVVLIVSGLLFTLLANDVSAITGFARKYQTACITCHEAPPRLNNVGEAFRINGYKFQDDETKVKQEALELGDEAYKRLWPQAVWPGQTPNYTPLSIISLWNIEVHTDPGVDPITKLDLPYVSFTMPHEIEIAWADSIGEHIALYGDIRFIQEDYGGGDMSSWAMLKGWIQFDDILVEDLLNIQIGSVGMHTIGLYNARSEHGFPFQGYLMNLVRMPDLNVQDFTGNFSVDNVRDFTGNTFVVQNQVGVELNGFTRHLYYYVGSVNGKIKNPFGSEPEDSVFFLGQGYNSSLKDYYAGLNIKIGGLGFNGLTGEEEMEPVFDTASEPQPSKGDEKFWRDNSLMISFFGYTGQGRIAIETWDDVNDKSKNGGYSVDYYDDDFWRAGVGLLQRYNDFAISGGYMWGKNENPYGALSSSEVETGSWFVESHYFLYPWLVPFVRYEGVDFDGLPTMTDADYDHDSDDTTPGTSVDLELDGEYDRTILTVGTKITIRPNVLLNIEGYYYTEDDDNVYANDKSIFFIFRAAF